MKEKATLLKIFSCKMPPPGENEKSDQKFDALLIFYRDSNGIKKTRFVPRAEAEFYIIKDKTSDEAVHPPMFIKEDKVERVITHSDMLLRDIAVRTASQAFYDKYKMIKSSGIKNLFKHPYLYGADMNVVDYYIAKFNEEFDPDPNYKLHKCFMDIEVDLMPDGFKKDSKGRIGYDGFPEEEIAPCPINIITLLDGKSKIMYSFIVKNEKNTSEIDFMSKVDSAKEEFLSKMENEDGVKLNGMEINFYNTEEAAIEAYFDKVHEIDPDMVLAWNMSFDYQTLMNRLKKLYDRKVNENNQRIDGYRAMLDKVCDSKYAVQTSEAGSQYYLSAKAKYTARKDKNIVDRIDYFDVLDGVIYCDQMLYYANIRKSGGQHESYALDAIAYEEIGRSKLEFEAGITIKTAPWVDFKTFTEYNQRDVLLLYILENKLLDADLMSALGQITNTRIEKAFAKTISLRNYVNKFAKENGYIMTTNRNQKYSDGDEEFTSKYNPTALLIEEDSDEIYRELYTRKQNYGALVGDPNLNDHYGVDGSMFVFENVCDQDFSALYPSIIRALNLDPTTQIGKFFLNDDNLKEELRSKGQIIEDEEDLGTLVCDVLQSHDWNAFGKKFMGLPGTSELIEEFSSK